MAAMQRLSLKAGQFIGFGLLSMLSGALFVARFETFAALAVGMGFLGIGVGMCVPAIAAGASLAVTAEEQGAIAGMVSSAPASAVSSSRPDGSTIQRCRISDSADYTGGAGAKTLTLGLNSLQCLS
jgi:hypothetical protein